MICGRARIWSSNTWLERGSWRASVAVMYTCSGNPAAAGSSCALMIRMTPDSLSRRTRCKVAAGDSPARRASSTLVRSASSWSAVSSWTSTSSSSSAIERNIISLLTPGDEHCMPKRQHGRMNTNRRPAVAALIAAGLLWGTTVPLSKLGLQWLSPGWLTTVRFGLAAAILLAAARRRGLRRAFTPAVLAAGALGYGGSVLLQNAGIGRTSVTHAALLIGAVPVLVAIIAAVWHRAVARRGRRGHGGRRGRRRDAGRGRPRAGVARLVGHGHRRPRAAAHRPRPYRGHRRAIPRRRTGLATDRGPHRGRARRTGSRRSRAGGPRAGRGRHVAAIHPVRVRTEPGLRRGRRGVPQPRAAGRRHRGRR